MSSADTSTIRHLVATLAYRAAKVLRDAPTSFVEMPSDGSSRSPVRILAHMGDLLEWALTIARGEYVWRANGGADWSTEVQRFFNGLEALDQQLATSDPPPGAIDKLVQGPLADALTHVGQLAMLRGMAGAPIRPESYAKAEIVIGRVGMTQAAPKREFDGDASAPK